jgi:hypothetical protein
LALCRLLHDDKPHDPHGEDAESKLIRDEKDRDLLIRLLDQVSLRCLSIEFHGFRLFSQNK